MTLEHRFNAKGNILISDQFNNRVIEVTPHGRIVWSFGLGPTDFTESSILGVNDAQRVGKLTLMAGTGIPQGAADNRVILVNEEKKIIWQYGQFGMAGNGPNLLNVPVQCTFIPGKHQKSNDHTLNGTVLITDQGNNRIIEVNWKKEIVWQYPIPTTPVQDLLNSPNSAEKLENGHILITDENNNRVLEVNRDHVVVHVFTAQGTLGTCAFASRLCDGHTLITDSGNSRIIEVNQSDQIVWQYVTNAIAGSLPAPLPSRGIRLRDGETLIADQFNNRVIQIEGTIKTNEWYGLPFNGTPGSNTGYNLQTTQLGLNAPYDAKIIGDYTGLTNPKGNHKD